MLEIRNRKLVIGGYVIGDEERLLSIFDKANKYDEIVKSGFITGGESQWLTNLKTIK